MSAFLDYVNMCAVGLMAGVTIRLAGYALNSYAMCAIALAAVAALWKWKVNPVWVVLGGGLAGMVLSAVL
jgi:chromate transporter